MAAKISAQKYGGRSVSIKVDIIGTTPQEVAAGVARLGKLPASVTNGPARYAAGRVSALAKKLAPKRTGLLRSGLKVSQKEKSSVKGKVVFDVRPMSESEWTAREEKRAARGKDARAYTFAVTTRGGKRYYYPASMEYGYRTRSGGREEGRYYLRSAADALQQVAEQIILDRAGRKLDELWLKQGGE